MAGKKSRAERVDHLPEETESVASGWIHWIFKDSLLLAMGPNNPEPKQAESHQLAMDSEAPVEALDTQGE